MSKKDLALLWEQDALEDRLNIFEYLYRYTPEAAEKTDNALEAAAESLRTNPERCARQEGGRGRRMVTPGLPFLIFFDLDEDLRLVRILRVLHQKQRTRSI